MYFLALFLEKKNMSRSDNNPVAIATLASRLLLYMLFLTKRNQDPSEKWLISCLGQNFYKKSQKYLGVQDKLLRL